MKRIFLLAMTLLGCSADIGTDDESLAVDHVEHISTISYAPNSFVIGNAYPGWTDKVQGAPQFSKGPGNENGASYRWGRLYGESFDFCAWIDNGDLNAGVHENAFECGAPQEIDTPHFFATFTNGMHNQLAGDGSLTHMHWAGSGCTTHEAYGNVEPWRVPATPHNPVGTIANGATLRWRYVTRDGNWVLVRDPSPPANQPTWYFVHRGCVSLANTN
jgi:hypothetical protein